jgi:hypothetical protein
MLRPTPPADTVTVPGFDVPAISDPALRPLMSTLAPPMTMTRGIGNRWAHHLALALLDEGVELVPHGLVDCRLLVVGERLLPHRIGLLPGLGLTRGQPLLVVAPVGDDGRIEGVGVAGQRMLRAEEVRRRGPPRGSPRAPSASSVVSSGCMNSLTIWIRSRRARTSRSWQTSPPSSQPAPCMIKLPPPMVRPHSENTLS